MRAEQALHAVWSRDSTSAKLLGPFAELFSVLVRGRRTAYRRGWLRTERLPVPVIVVGNITVGGTGKTPVVDWLVGELGRAGYRPGIASRGYGGAEPAAPVLVSPDSHAAAVGDEALLLARRTGVPVAVCRDRVKAARLLIDAGVDTVVCDDGLQHYRLWRDVEIAVVDGDRGLGNGRLLPAGPLREPPLRLREVNVVMINGQSRSIPGFQFTLEGGSAVSLVTARVEQLSSFNGKRVWALAGIGNPARFFAYLRQRGLDPVPVPLADHARADLGRIRERGEWPIVMTEKDAVKYPGCAVAETWYVPVKLCMTAEAEAAVMSRILAGLVRHAGGRSPVHA